jgi:hypothetical protein
MSEVDSHLQFEPLPDSISELDTREILSFHEVLETYFVKYTTNLRKSPQPISALALIGELHP